MKCPCKDCDNKGCGAYHAQCEKYLDWKKELEEYRKQEKQRNEIYAYRRDCV